MSQTINGKPNCPHANDPQSLVVIVAWPTAARVRIEAVRELLPLTPEQRAKAEAHLRNPAPGSRIEAAQKYGVNLGLLIEQLRLTPAERARKLQSAVNAMEEIRGTACHAAK